MNVSELIIELQKIADQGDAWKNAEVEWYGTEEETAKRGGPCSLGDLEQMDFGDHLLVVINAYESP
jgi:hypothetical protein